MTEMKPKRRFTAKEKMRRTLFRMFLYEERRRGTVTGVLAALVMAAALTFGQWQVCLPVHPVIKGLLCALDAALFFCTVIALTALWYYAQNRTGFTVLYRRYSRTFGRQNTGRQQVG
jgi:uncharacterized membrane protein